MAHRKLNPELVAFVSGIARFIDETDQKAASTTRTRFNTIIDDAARHSAVQAKENDNEDE